MSVPVVNVLHKQVHLEITRVDRFVERLQQETSLTMSNVGKIFRRPWNLEPERQVELLRFLEVPRWHERFDFDSGEVHDDGFRGLTSKVTGDHGLAEGPPVGVRVDRRVGHQLRKIGDGETHALTLAEELTEAMLRIAETFVSENHRLLLSHRVFNKPLLM